MKDCTSKSTLMKKKIRLNILNNTDENLTDKSLCKTDKEHYQQTIESLLYLSLETRSDISFAVVILSQFTANLHEKHKTALNQIFHYLRSTLDVDIIYYIVKSPIPTGFTDASFAHLIVKKDCCSTSEYIFFMAGGPVSWSCKHQSTVTTSFIKTEYIGQYNAA